MKILITEFFNVGSKTGENFRGRLKVNILKGYIEVAVLIIVLLIKRVKRRICRFID